MQFISDPAIALKISQMQRRVRWQESALRHRQIDQTTFRLEDGRSQETAFSFLVVGDSGSRSYRNDHPQRRVAEAILPHQADCRFMLHTGDVVYLVGSSEQYFQNFVDPYREWLVGGEQAEAIAYDQMIFKTPILPVLGNHDYYDLPLFWGILSKFSEPLRRIFRQHIHFDVGFHGSFQGDAYARAFLDYLANYEGAELSRHLDRHYWAESPKGRCLVYQPGEFTRLPNRYYQFRYGGIDFFALDSNTFNAPLPIPLTEKGEQLRQQLREQRLKLIQRQQALLQKTVFLNPANPEDADDLEDCYVKREQISERIRDIDRQLDPSEQSEYLDQAQLDWLCEQLVRSWESDARGRVLLFHHPPYVTESTKWDQGQTLAVRHNLRWVLDQVQAQIGRKNQGRSLVDLVICGHAHCLEYLKTEETGHGDRQINWLVCGGSGFSLRRQRQEGPLLREGRGEHAPVIAQSQLFLGRNGQGNRKHRPYSFARIDIQAHNDLEIKLSPYVVERVEREWHCSPTQSFSLGTSTMMS